MTKRAESKYKINRRLGVNLWGGQIPDQQAQRRPGQHGQRRKKATDYGTQLMAKQKLRGYYGNISESSSADTTKRRCACEAIRASR